MRIAMSDHFNSAGGSAGQNQTGATQGGLASLLMPFLAGGGYGGTPGQSTSPIDPRTRRPAHGQPVQTPYLTNGGQAGGIGAAAGQAGGIGVAAGASASGDSAGPY